MYDKRKKVLVVDDEEINRKILKTVLDKDYEILEAGSGKQAIELVKEHGLNISMILLDLIMPDVDGFGVLGFLNEYGYITEIPVICITADCKYESEKQTFDLGVCDFIAKPFHKEVVKRRVKNMIDLFERTTCLRKLVEEQMVEIYEQSEQIQELLLGLQEENKR